MDIAEVRAKFPQYSDMSDGQLADALHAKYYSDVPKEKFYGDIGFKAAPAEAPAAEKPSIGADMLQGFLRGGVGGAATAGFGRGMDTVNDLVSKGAYKAGDAVSRGATAVGLPAEAAGAAGYATNVGLQAIPALAGGQIGKQAAPLLENAGTRLMTSAMKPNLKASLNGNGERAVQTMFDEGLNATNGGVKELTKRREDVSGQLSDTLQKYNGITLDKGAIASRIQDVVKRIEKSNPTPQDALKDVTKVYDDFMSNGLIPKNIPIQAVNEFKSGIYRVLREKYGAMASDSVEAQKALARGMKEEINLMAPEVVALNARQGNLANARNIAERRVAVEGNSNLAGLAPLAHGLPAAAGFLLDKYGLSKSILARLLHSGAQPIAQTGGAATGGILQQLLQDQQ